jgi:membrane associated rhomboid family serine protease
VIIEWETQAIWLKSYGDRCDCWWVNSKMDVKVGQEPLFNAPPAALAVAALILGGYFLQAQGLVAQDLPRWGYSAANLAAGRPETLITALFLHGSWPHALMNAAMGLAFATPVARFVGSTLRGSFVFLFYYLACGALANYGFGLLHPDDPEVLIGASGAVSALAAGSARLIGGSGEVGPLLSPFVLGMGGAWLVINLLTAVLGFAPGAGGAAVAWEAHLIGFALGLVLIPLAAAIAAPKP